MNTSPSKTSNESSQEYSEDLDTELLSPDTETTSPSSPPPTQQGNLVVTELRYDSRGKLDRSLLSTGQVRMIKYFRERPIVSEACKLARVSRDTHYRWIKENRVYEEFIARAKQEANDFAKGKLWDRVSRADLNALKYYLEHNDPDYANNLQVTHSMSPSWYEKMAGPSPKKMGVQVKGKDEHWVNKAIDREDVEGANQMLIKAAVTKINNDATRQSGTDQESGIRTEELPAPGTQ